VSSSPESLDARDMRLPDARLRDVSVPVRALVATAPVAVALALWALSLQGVDLDRMTDLGLISVLPPAFYVAVAVLTAGFVAALVAPVLRPVVLALHATALIAVLHATPTILYGTLRYGWSWKHVGIVDYIQRHHAVDQHYWFLQAYHDWPGFFSLGTLAVDAMGERTAVGIASWAPPFFALLFLGAVLFVAGGLTSNRRVAWGAALVFLLGNWVGQDYFAPQALSYFLYLIIIGIALRWFGLRGPAPAAGPRTRGALIGLSIAASAAIVTSHQLTPFLLIAALVGLRVVRQAHVPWLLPAVILMTGAWIATAARPFLDNNWYWIADSIGSPGGNASSTLISLGRASDGMSLVAHGDRALTAAVILLAAAGALRRLWLGHVERAALVLAACPCVALAGTSYGGEILFRVYFFALPFLALLGAYALPIRSASAGHNGSRAFVAVASAVLVSGFCVSYYGKERMHRFSRDEVAASEWLYRTAPADSLMLSGTFDYPWAFSRYEQFEYEALATDPLGRRRRVIARPARVVEALLDDRPRPGAYLVIGRAQQAAVDMTGVMPSGTLQRIERAVAASPRFELVFDRPGAKIFRLRRDR
jgi:hypothetical protein